MKVSVSSVWNNKIIPVIAVPPSRGKLKVRLPYNPANRTWLKIGQREPEWDRAKKCWLLPRAWLNRIAKHAVESFGQCYLIQARTSTETCAPACRNSASVDCECSCDGEHHGEDSDERWFDVSETFSCRAGGTDYSIRLLVWRDAVVPSEDDLMARAGIRWYTYFIRSGSLVKIGKSTDVESRVKTLQTANARKLEILGVIEGDFERHLHSRFEQHRVGGEWFQFDDQSMRDLVTLIRAHEVN